MVETGWCAPSKIRLYLFEMYTVRTITHYPSLVNINIYPELPAAQLAPIFHTDISFFLQHLLFLIYPPYPLPKELKKNDESKNPTQY